MLLRSHHTTDNDTQGETQPLHDAPLSPSPRPGRVDEAPTIPTQYAPPSRHAEPPLRQLPPVRESSPAETGPIPTTRSGSASDQGIHYTLGNGVTIGSAPDNTIVLDSPLVSAHHARIILSQRGEYVLSDLGGTHGTFLNGFHVRNARLMPGAEIRIGSYSFVFTGTELTQYDVGKSIRVDAIDLSTSVPAGLFGLKRKPLLDHLSLSILPGSFVALVGPSGAGKTTLLNALSGQVPADRGTVLYNGQDFYDHMSSFSSSIGYVPQDDIIHKNLTVERALYYAARLRLSKDLSRRQIWQRVTQVLEDVDMVGQRKQLISKLSGGQRKRASIGVELLARPPVFYLDEPTSGLDPGLDRSLMQLLRRLADRGQTIVLSTHATSDISMCDYVCFIAPGGRIAYYGPPERMKQHFGVSNYANIYTEVSQDPARAVSLYQESPDYLTYIASPELQSRSRSQAQAQASRQGARIPQPRRSQQFRQFRLLTQRYVELTVRDRMNLLILLAQAPIIAGLVILLAASNSIHHVSTPLDFISPSDYDAQRTLFIIVCSAVWFGTINSAREIVKEAPIYRRERSINLGLAPYIFSKVVVLGALCAVQSFLLLYIVGLKTGYPTHGILFPHTSGGFAEMYITLLLTSLAGLAIGLVISALAPNTDRAVSMVPIVLIPQIIFANVIFTLSGVGNVISWIMPSRWGMQALGSIAHLHDKFAAQDKPFYNATRPHEIGFWLALIAIMVVLTTVTLLLQRMKDVRQ